MTTQDQTLLEAALIGFQHQADQLAGKIAEIQRQLGGRTASSAPKTAAAAAAPAKKRSMSAAARKRIAAAQKKRWAEYHRQKEAKS